jgi:hypothetical protein
VSVLRAGQCTECGVADKLVGPLHLEKGGPIVCLPCGTEWHAKQAGDRKKHQRVLQMFGFGTSYAEPQELTLELLEEAVRLTHPDRHLDRVEQATRVTAELLALKPFVRPKPPSNASAIVRPPPFRVSVTPPGNGSATSQAPQVKKPSQPAYPCETCRDTVPYYYCDACRDWWDAKKREERETDNAKQREGRARRRRRRPPAKCAACGTYFKGRRKDARYCSAACRQRAHRKLHAQPDHDARP